MRPIISNIGTATYDLAKHLAKLLSPLSKSTYTVSSTNDLVNILKCETVPHDYDFVSFDVTSLFTNVSLEFTMDLILRKVYEEKLVETDIPKKEMKELLLLCTKNLYFEFNGEMFQQLDGVAMGSPLVLVIAGIFMVELENTVVPALNNYLPFRKRYVDDTLCFVKKGYRDYVLSVLNDFHDCISFTFEEQVNSMISFLDVLLIRKPDGMDLAVFRKKTNTNLYVNWDAFALETW